MDSRLELCSGAGMNDMGRMQSDRTQRSSARTRQGRDAQGTQVVVCPQACSVNHYSIQPRLQNIEDWSTKVSSYSPSKDANHQGQNSQAPFQGKEDLTPQLVQLQQRPANPML
jgi:hypothetical protein